MNPGALQALDQRLSGNLEELDEFAQELMQLDSGLPRRINIDHDRVEHGLAKLVLAVIELVRRLLEQQALRRIEAGSLNEEQIERMGMTFMKLDQKMIELKAAFGLEDDDLNLNLGPLGNLM